MRHPNLTVMATEQTQVEVGESQPIAHLGHEHIMEASLGLKLEIPSVSDSNS